MKLNHHFNKFHSNISLDKGRIARISSAISNLETYLNSDEEIADHLLDFFVQGSIATNTAIKPLKENLEFDVDIVILFNVNELPEDYRTPEGILDWIAERLRKNSPHYDGKVRKKNRCVRINYAGDFHLDIVPANCNGNTEMPIWVPDRKNDTWHLSHPKGFIKWVFEKDIVSNKKFHRIMKMLKYWRDEKFGIESRPPSILFTTLIGTYFTSSHSSDADALVSVMKDLSSYLESINFVPAVFNPSLLSENLAENWEQEDFDLFKNRFIKATEIAEEAIDEEDKNKSIEYWQRIFSEFPSSIEEDTKALADAIKAGSAYVNTSGGITAQKPQDTVSTNIPKHRTYGDY